jgi:hypothetical protein
MRGLLAAGGELRIGVYARFSAANLYMTLMWLARNRMRNSLSDWRSHFAEGSRLGDPVVIKIRGRGEVEAMLARAGFEVVRYGRKGFVQRYLPGVGRFLEPDGAVLNTFAAVLGWYHCFICRPRQ